MSWAPAPALGLGANRRQFSLLVLVNAFVGAMVGIERSVVPLLARDEFGIASATLALSFIAAFGATKAIANLFAGHLGDRYGRKRILVAGWLAAIPVPLLVIWAPSWGWVIAANILLGVNQGLAWSMTVVMKVDLAGPRRRGLALGLNEAAGYVAVAVAAFGAGALAAAHGPRPAPFVLGAGIAATGLFLSVRFVAETAGHVRAEDTGAAARPFGEAFRAVAGRDPTLAAAAQAGLVNNLNDAMIWGLVPIYLAARGLTVGRIALVAAAYPVVWGLGQLATGALSDVIGRKPPIVAGLLVQAGAIAVFPLLSSFAGWLCASAVMGAGTALVYPTLIAVVGDVAAPGWRGAAIGAYRFWRDAGYAVGAVATGLASDAFGQRAAILVVAVVTAISGGIVIRRMRETVPRTA